jgi:DNA-binding LytR/AlgR family response regulator
MRVLKKDGSPWEIEEDDILYFASYQNTIFVCTAEDEFIYPTSLSDLFAAYREIRFDRLDRSNLVNTDNITDYDAERKVVFFNDKKVPFAVVSEPNEKKVKRIVEMKRKGEGPSE